MCLMDLWQLLLWQLNGTSVDWMTMYVWNYLRNGGYTRM